MKDALEEDFGFSSEENKEKIRKKQQAAIDAEKAKYEEAARREVEEQEKKNKIHAEEERMKMEIAKAKADAATKIAMAKAKEVSSKAAAEDKVMQEIEAKMHPKDEDDDDPNRIPLYVAFTSFSFIKHRSFFSFSLSS